MRVNYPFYPTNFPLAQFTIDFPTNCIKCGFYVSKDGRTLAEYVKPTSWLEGESGWENNVLISTSHCARNLLSENEMMQLFILEPFPSSMPCCRRKKTFSHHNICSAFSFLSLRHQHPPPNFGRMDGWRNFRGEKRNTTMTCSAGIIIIIIRMASTTHIFAVLLPKPKSHWEKSE